MALKTRYWLEGLFLGCAVIMTAYLPPDPDPEIPDGARRFVVRANQNRTEQVQVALIRAQDALGVLQRRDSVLARLGPARAPVSGAPVLLASPPLDPALRRQVDQILAPARAAAGTDSNAVRVAVVVSRGPAWTDAPRPMRAVYITPPATDGKTCLALKLTYTRERRNASGRVIQAATRELETSGILGPCAFYSAFGRPGAKIEAWLMQNHFDVALISDWSRTRSPSVFYGPPLACVQGDTTTCRSYLSRQPTSDGFLFRPVHVERGWPRGVIGVRYLFGSRRPGLLADLRADFGDARFGRFWQSNLDLESAFAEAFGMPAGQWVARWARQYRPRDLPEHVEIPSSSIALALALVLVLTAVGLAYADRRQVG